MSARELSGHNVMITGGTGFIGGRLAEVLCLSSEAQVSIMARNPAKTSRIARFPVAFCYGDVSSPEDVRKAVEGQDIVFHCAYGSQGDAETQRLVNVEGTRNIIHAAAEAGVRRVVHVSTIEVYEPVDGSISEESPKYSGEIVYAASKLEAERLALTEGQRLGIEVSVVQPTVVYGPYGTFWTVRPLMEMRQGRIVLIDGGTGLCNAVYVDDVVAGLMLAATRSEAVGEKILISGSEPVTWADFYAAYEKMLGVSATKVASTDAAASMWQSAHSQKSTISYFSNLWRSDPVFREKLRMAPAIQKLYGLGHRVISPDRWQNLRDRLEVKDNDDGSTPVTPEECDRPVLWPDPDAITFYSRRFRVDVGKAERLLGYKPIISLSKGMMRTYRWAVWHNLAPQGKTL